MAKYTPDHKGVAKFLQSSRLTDATEHYANQIATTARLLAPRSGDGEGIPYADGIVVEANAYGGRKGDRTQFEVIATEGHPTLVEWGRKPGNGSPGFEGQHVMRRAVEEVTKQ